MVIRPEDAASWKKEEKKVKTLGKAGSKSLKVGLNFFYRKVRREKADFAEQTEER